ncbi:17S U2 SnRNP complex component HTATSF1-like [Oscarella lobularis]|uniref:17S U2 SnRNP complex component HTATSF1-like n=1 Tax=Oscarella lobularis TaxID=121494 RepID=UPI003313AB7D
MSDKPDNSAATADFVAELKASVAPAAAPNPSESKKTFIDPQDGTVFEWDDEKKAWFPKVDEEFIAGYQANYGFTPEAQEWSKRAAEAAALPPEKPQKKKKAEKSGIPKTKPEEPAAGWFDVDESKNRNVYVSGLHEDTTLEEFTELMSKCGIIMEDPDTNKPKIKLYQDEEGHLKGDGLCGYLKKESVDLAIKLLDESLFKGKKLSIERAKFAQKGDYNTALRKKKKKVKKRKANTQEKLLGWQESTQKRAKNERIVIFKNMFEPKEFEENPVAITDIKDDIMEECKKFGHVKKVLIFDRHPDGVASVAFREQEMADECVSAMNGRFFGGKSIVVELWDGTTDYQVEETSKEREERLKNWETFLEKS